MYCLARFVDKKGFEKLETVEYPPPPVKRFQVMEPISNSQWTNHFDDISINISYITFELTGVKIDPSTGYGVKAVYKEVTSIYNNKCPSCSGRDTLITKLQNLLEVLEGEDKSHSAGVLRQILVQEKALPHTVQKGVQ